MAVTRRLVESFLRLNQLTPSSSREDIKNVLVRARWSDAEIEDAFRICDECALELAEPVVIPPRVEKTPIHPNYAGITRTQAVLGLDIVIDPFTFALPKKQKKKPKIFWEVVKFVSSVIIACLAAFLFGVALFYHFEIGPFYTSAEATQ